MKQWKEPKRRGGPSMSTRAVVRELGYSTVESVHILVRRGPENDGLAGYIPAPDGNGWQRKQVPTPEERAAMKAAGTPYIPASGVEVMFYREDVEAWKKAHPVRLRSDYSDVVYTDEQKALVLAEAEKLKSEEGHVTRTRLLERLYKIDKSWNDRKYRVLRKILEDNGIDRPPRRVDTNQNRRSSRRRIS